MLPGESVGVARLFLGLRQCRHLPCALLLSRSAFSSLGRKRRLGALNGRSLCWTGRCWSRRRRRRDDLLGLLGGARDSLLIGKRPRLRSALRAFDPRRRGADHHIESHADNGAQNQQRNDELVNRRISPSLAAISTGNAATACQTRPIIDGLSLIFREPLQPPRGFGKASHRKR
jgi:hypothetical protein